MEKPTVILCQRVTDMHPRYAVKSKIVCCHRCREEVRLAESTTESIAAAGHSMDEIELVCLDCAEPYLRTGSFETVPLQPIQIRDIVDTLRRRKQH